MPAPPPESEPAMVSGDRGHRPPSARASAPSTTRAQVARRLGRSRRASDSAEITATPSAPAAITSAALAASMPAMAQIGKFALARADRVDDRRASRRCRSAAAVLSFDVVA